VAGSKTQFSATVIDGMFKPDGVLPLPDQTRVVLTMESIDARPDAVSAWTALKARLRLRPILAGGLKFTRDELHERN